MADANVGRRMMTPSWDPPWIVVDRQLDSVIMARWPGRLFRIASVPSSSEEERLAVAGAAEGLHADARYTRFFVADVLAELPTGTLFGPHGDAVVEILECARHLTEPVARKLAAAQWWMIRQRVDVDAPGSPAQRRHWLVGFGNCYGRFQPMIFPGRWLMRSSTARVSPGPWTLRLVHFAEVLSRRMRETGGSTVVAGIETPSGAEPAVFMPRSASRLDGDGASVGRRTSRPRSSSPAAGSHLADTCGAATS
ncbi:hypothetical protein SAMN05421812_11018 [Asanoa hainanensis]|uniref:Uncharacterized protein n=1 Tax=Asanoa hainanensis TaxID=560556 RepID=A0A239NRI4_9ACTN|nr:hypothetical protein SAMN05421812_11018 [Asanoa hainanensis]